MIELGGNITLVGFKELGYAELVVIKKVVGSYARKFAEGKIMNNLTLNLKPIHQTSEESLKYEIKAKLDLDGKMFNSDVTEFNLFIGLDKVLKKIESQLR